MKKCPQCGTTYTDEMNFCLNDGLTLISTEPMPTQQLNVNVPQTQDFDDHETKFAGQIRVEIPKYEQPQTFNAGNIPPNSFQTVAERPKTPILLFLALPIIGIALGAGLIWFFLRPTTNNIPVSNISNTNPTNSVNAPSNSDVATVKTPNNSTKNQNSWIKETPKPSPSPTASTSPSSTSTPTPSPSPTPTKTPKPSGCYLSDGGKGGGEVNLRRNCDSLDCENDPATLIGTYSNDTPVKKIGSPITSDKYTWIKVLVKGQTGWVAATKIRCD